MGQVRFLLFYLLLIATAVLHYDHYGECLPPTMEDNKLPTDEEIILHLTNKYLNERANAAADAASASAAKEEPGGQPEQEMSLGLPTDQQVFNEIQQFYSNRPHPHLPYDGNDDHDDSNNNYFTYSFPEIDARGFHESVFDLDNYYPLSRRGKKNDNSVPVSARGFYGDIFTDGFGTFQPVKKFYRDLEPMSAERLQEIMKLHRSAIQNGNGNRNRNKRSLLLNSNLFRINNTTVLVTNGTTNRLYDNYLFRTNSDDTVAVAEGHTIETGSGFKSIPVTMIDLKTKCHLFDNGTCKSIYSNNNSKERSGVTNKNREAVIGLANTTGKTTATIIEKRSLVRSHPISDADLYWRRLICDSADKEASLCAFANVPGRDEQIPLTNTNRMKKRNTNMDALGFNGDVFNRGFGVFYPAKKRGSGSRSAAAAFHGDIFHGGFGHFDTLRKRRPEMDSLGFHADVFNREFGNFDTAKKRRAEDVGSNAFRADVFEGGLGSSFDRLKNNRRSDVVDSPSHLGNIIFFNRAFGFSDADAVKKRVTEVESKGFHGDVFHGAFGRFDTVKKNTPEVGPTSFHGGFGHFDTVKKRRPEMESTGFNGDVFHGSFGRFDTLKKRRPEMDSLGFHGDVFNQGFGNFDMVEKRRQPDAGSAGFHGDVFHGSFGSFDTLKKRTPEMDSLGFHGDIFNRGFGNFYTVKKRSPEMSYGGYFDTVKSSKLNNDQSIAKGPSNNDDASFKKRKPFMDSSGFYGDVFNRGFSKFYTVKRRPEMDSSRLNTGFSKAVGNFDVLEKVEQMQPFPADVDHVVDDSNNIGEEIKGNITPSSSSTKERKK